MTVGEVYWVRFRSADGHEQAGRRPGIILQDAAVGNDLPTVLTVPLTTAVAARRFAGTVAIEATPENGLREESIVLLFRLTAVDRARVAVCREPSGLCGGRREDFWRRHGARRLPERSGLRRRRAAEL